MRQSRLMSFVEAVANVVVGYGVAVAMQTLVFPLFGLSATIGTTAKAVASSRVWVITQRTTGAR